MKPLSLAPRAACRHPACFAALLLIACPLLAEPAPTPWPATPKQYILFVGADVMAEFDGKEHPVIGASRGSLQIKTGAQTEVVPSRRVRGFRAERGMKLSTLKANINIHAASIRAAADRERGAVELDAMAVVRKEEQRLEEMQGQMVHDQAFGGDPTRKTEEAQDQQLSAIADASQNVNRLRDAMDGYVAKKTDEIEHDNRFRRATKNAAGQANPVPDLPFRYEDDPVADGLELKCEISSPLPLEKAYLAVSVRYVDPRMPRRNLQRVEFQPLGDVDEKPRKLTVSLSGMPRGFHLIGCDVDLYGNGQQVATNLSDVQMAMNEEEAYQYYLVDYLSRNRGKTRPPAPLLFAPPGELLRLQFDPAELDREIYARVDKHGRVISLSTDKAGKIDVPAQVFAIMGFFRFYPALENGKAVEGRVKFKPSDLLR